MTEREFVQKLKEIGFVDDTMARSTYIREGLKVFVVPPLAEIRVGAGGHWEDFEVILSKLGVPSQAEEAIVDARRFGAEQMRDKIEREIYSLRGFFGDKTVDDMAKIVRNIPLP